MITNEECQTLLRHKESERVARSRVSAGPGKEGFPRGRGVARSGEVPRAAGTLQTTGS